MTHYEIGTLVSGWSTKNKHAVIPHSERPASARGKTSREEWKKHGEERQKHAEEYVKVLIRGIEREVPRNAVVPCAELEPPKARPSSARGEKQEYAMVLVRGVNQLVPASKLQ